MKLYLAVILLFLTSTASHSQPETDSSFTGSTVPQVVVREIILAGNEKTDEDVILREIHTREGSLLDVEILQGDIDRLKNLGLFTKIEVFPVPTEKTDTIDLLFTLEESIYFIPLPQGGFRNGQFSQFWAGLNLLWRNFRGRNETINLGFGIGAEPFANLSYTVPWIGEKDHYFLSMSVGYSRDNNQSLETINSTTNEIPDSDENYKIDNFRSAVTLGKFFGSNMSATGILRYNSIVTSQYEPGRTVSPDGKDQFFVFTANGRYDTRNSYNYTTSGTLLFLEYSKNGFGGLIDFNRVGIDARQFIPFELFKGYEVSLGLSTTGAVSFGGSIPSYMKEYFGYGKVIRGHKKLVYEGDNRLGFFNEVRLPIISEIYFSGKSIPGLKGISMFRKLSYRFAMYSTLFFDIGTTWNKTDNFFKATYHKGFGVGLNFLLPFGLVGRTDFAFRRDGKRYVPQIIVDLNAAF